MGLPTKVGSQQRANFIMKRCFETIETRRLHIRSARTEAAAGGCTVHPHVRWDILSHEHEVQRAHVSPHPSGYDAIECAGHDRIEEVPARNAEERRWVEPVQRVP